MHFTQPVSRTAARQHEKNVLTKASQPRNHFFVTRRGISNLGLLSLFKYPKIFNVFQYQDLTRRLGHAF